MGRGRAWKRRRVSANAVDWSRKNASRDGGAGKAENGSKNRALAKWPRPAVHCTTRVSEGHLLIVGQ